MRPISPCLWFNGCAEEAVKFYVATFPHSRIKQRTVYDADAAVSGNRPGSLMTLTFELNGTEYMALNGGPQYPFTPAVSLMVPCDTQADIDRYWNALLEGGGKPGRCGWLTDRFGLSWQVIPTRIADMLQHPDAEKRDRMIQLLRTMEKLDIAKLEDSFYGA